MRIALAASLLFLAGCASHEKAAATSTDPNVVLASSGGSCHGGAANAEMASTDGAKSCHAVKAELASTEAGKSCHAAKGVELASAESHTCGNCPEKADGSCDHEAGAKAGRECCKAQLAKTTAP